MTVLFAGQNIDKSPFGVNVGMALGDANKVTARGPGLEPVGNVANKPTYFDIYTAGGLWWPPRDGGVTAPGWWWGRGVARCRLASRACPRGGVATVGLGGAEATSSWWHGHGTAWWLCCCVLMAAWPGDVEATSSW